MIKWFFLLVIISCCTITEAQRTTFNFNAGWKLWTGDDTAYRHSGFNDRIWKTVTLPHAWNEDDAFQKDIVDLSTGIAWYRKQFKVPRNCFLNLKAYDRRPKCI